MCAELSHDKINYSKRRYAAGCLVVLIVVVGLIYLNIPPSGIYRAAYFGNVEKLKYYINRGDDINETQANLISKSTAPRTPLLWAIMGNRPQSAKMLIDAGCIVDSSGFQINTPFYEAVVLGRDEIVQLILETGVDPNVRGFEGDTPLLLAMHGKHYEVAIKLLEHGADPMIATDYGASAIDEFAIFSLDEPKYTTLISMSVSAGCPPDHRFLSEYSQDTTLLMYAASLGYTDLVELLVDNGADSEAKDEHGNHALQYLEWSEANEATKKIISTLLDK